MANRLARETSPYLLQHKDNPVDWYPWGEEALARARAENKPILLSIGYSACHWCHVMEHESFENEAIAKLMNEHFVNIKVDREERPDLDHVYQNVAQALTGGGGWPLTVFLTPDLKPFFGGTYFPPEDKFGRPGFPRVLRALADAYRAEPENVRTNAERLVEAIRREEGGAATAPAAMARPAFPQLVDAADLLLRSYLDWDHGGFGSAPKFPNPMLLDFLWRVAASGGHEKAREGVLLSLGKMARGGVYDHLGGGFHRYSVDERWAVPHFEKMLYDNALLLRLYSQVSLSDRCPEAERGEFVSVVAETVEYLLREMVSPDGAFYSTQDADTEGEEGKFFVWNLDELTRALTEDEAKAFALRYGVTPEGNFEHGKTVLAVTRPIDDVAASLGLSPEETELLVRSAREKLFEDRERRVRPGRDEKALASWNGLMISGLYWSAQALARGGQAALAERAREAAGRAFDFVVSCMSQAAPGPRLWSVHKDGRARFNAYLDDYAFMAMAALDRSRFARDDAETASALGHCASWIGEILAHFGDPDAPGYFFTSDGHEKLIHRPKALYDQAIPSGTSVVLGVLSALAEIDWDGQGQRFDADLERQLAPLHALSVRNPFGFGELLCAASLDALGPVVVSGDGSDAAVVNPQVFRKPKDAAHPPGKWLVCHQRTCSAPLDRAEAGAQALSKTSI